MRYDILNAINAAQGQILKCKYVDLCQMKQLKANTQYHINNPRVTETTCLSKKVSLRCHERFYTMIQYVDYKQISWIEL